MAKNNNARRLKLGEFVGSNRAPLGKYTKSSPPSKWREKIRANRAERYELLASARALFLHGSKK